MNLPKLFLNIACSFLLVVIGSYVWSHYISKPTITTKVVVIERPVFIPGKTVTLPGKPVLVPDTSRSAREDSLMAALAKSGKLDSLARWRGQKFETEFIDTVTASDTSGNSFRLRETHKVQVDGATQLITKTVKYWDAYIKAKQVEITSNTTSLDFITAGLVLVGGVVIGLLIAILGLA